jgi:hypothetical protein
LRIAVEMDDAVGHRRIDHACFNRCQRCISEQMLIIRVYRIEVLMPRFTIGERVEVSGVLEEFTSVSSERFLLSHQTWMASPDL